MNLELLKQEFQEINEVFFEKEAGANFLRIEVNLKDLDKITALSRKISTYLDDKEIEYENYFLDIYSSGTDQNIDVNKIGDYLDKHVLITLQNIKIHDRNEIEGYIISDNPITIKWNKKGQIRKDLVEKENIKEIKLYAKAGK